ncbi:tryptophanyl-tRNA synthetase [Phakopsora pachyrhizi]|uniref:Tryptophan--tRNA ligase, mitochondrial n=1 Tax=Phakopsora pachyrhizi TaxID=170000 RepID=A0AAV0B0B5_PHAPC|nr:tryptophanyl-tRNA synthetase [Phakopsora pachyrhizi]
MDSSNDTSEGKGETLRPTPRRVTFSGIQPTGIPHIGNYIGALKSWLRIQDDHHLESGREEVFYSIVGLHSLTIPRDPARLRKDRFEMMCCLLAIGLKPNRCCLFNQDDVPAHSELAWILGCLTSVGKLNRMTTWKSKIADSKQSNSLDEVDDRSLHLGLLSYPVLQTADILLYRSTQVPVGADQEQHIELTRSIAKSFNKKFRTNLFPLPRPILTPQAKILNLRNPIQKMSKSSPSVQSRILITDSPQGIRSKITSAVTDSIKFVTYDPINRPGISNLLDIYRSITGEEESMSKRFEGRMADELKSQLVDVLVEELRPIQVEFERLQGERTAVEKVFELGAVRANAAAQNTLKEVKLKIGLL